MAAMLSAFARLVRERPAGSASVLLACTVDEEFTHTGSSRLAEIRPWGRPGDRRRADLAQPRPLPQGCPAVEDPDPGASPATARRRTWASTPSTGWARVLEALEKYAGTLAASDARPDPRAADPVGRPDRGGAERQRRPRLVRDRSRSPPDPRRGRGDLPGRGRESCSRELLGRPRRRSNSASPGCTCRPLAPRAADWLEPLADAIATATGRRPEVMGVPFGTDAGPLERSRERPASSSGPATSPRPTPRTNGSSSSRSSSPPRPTSRSPSTWAAIG